MPAQRQTRAQVRLQSLRSARSRSLAFIGPRSGVESRQSSPGLEDVDVFGTLLPNSFITPAREVPQELIKTEPSTPESPLIRPSNRNLRREPSVHLFHVQAVLHFDRSENDLQPWHW
jgi:hypothetical protein